MKEKLLEKLKTPEIDRNFRWFWVNHIKPNHKITYSHFMVMLNGISPLRDDIKEAIESYIEG